MSLLVTFKVKFMFEHYFQYGNFKFKQNDRVPQKKTKPHVATALKKTSLIKQFYGHCSGNALFLISLYL